MLYGFLIKMNNSWFQSIIKPDIKGILGKNILGKKSTGMGLTPYVAWQLSVPYSIVYFWPSPHQSHFFDCFQVMFPNTTSLFPAL